MMRGLVTRYGLAPSEIFSLSINAIHALMESNDPDVLTFADAASMQRFLQQAQGHE